MGKIYSFFIKGLLAILPIAITLQIVLWLAAVAEDGFGAPLAAFLPSGFYVTGMGLLVGFVCLITIGFLINNYLTSQLFVWGEGQLQKIPLIKIIYNPIRDIMNMFSGDHALGMKRVVMVRLTGDADGQGVEVPGLVTRDHFEDSQLGRLDPQQKRQMLAVYIPFSYAMGGFTVIVPKSRIRETQMTPQQALQLAITGWIKAQEPQGNDQTQTPNSQS